MKHLWIGALLLCCLLVLGAVVSYGVQQVQKPLTAQLEQAAEAGFGEDWTNAEGFLTAARDQWEKYRNFLAAVVDHKPMEEIDSLFGEVEVYQKIKDSTLFAGTCQKLGQLTQAIGEAYRLSWWNLL